MTILNKVTGQRDWRAERNQLIEELAEEMREGTEELFRIEEFLNRRLLFVENLLNYLGRIYIRTVYFVRKLRSRNE